MVYLF